MSCQIQIILALKLITIQVILNLQLLFVSAGDLVTRKRYNTITDSAASYKNPLGQDVANALSYGVSSTVILRRIKLGYPLKQTPTFSKYSDEMKKCFVTK